MNESDINKLVAESFMLGYQITVQAMFGESASNRSLSELWKLLHEVADGEATLTDSPAETWGRVPELQDAEAAEFYTRFTRWQMQDEARVAQRVVAAFFENDSD